MYGTARRLRSCGVESALLFAYLFRDLFRTAALSAGYAILLLYRMPGQLGRTTFLTRLLSRFPACQLQDVVWFGDYTIEKTGGLLWSSLLLFLLATALSGVLFCRAELK